VPVATASLLWALTGGRAPRREEEEYFLDEMPLAKVFAYWHCYNFDDEYHWTVRDLAGRDGSAACEKAVAIARAVQAQEEEDDPDL